MCYLRILPIFLSLFEFFSSNNFLGIKKFEELLNKDYCLLSKSGELILVALKFPLDSNNSKPSIS